MMNTELRILTKRNSLLFISFFSLYLGYMLGNRLLVCFGFGLLFLLFFAWHAAHNFFHEFKASRNHYPRTFEEAELRIAIRLVPGTKIPIYMLEVVDIFPPGDSWHVRALVPVRLDTSSGVELEYSAICTRRRGIYVLGPLEITAADPLGIHVRRMELPVITDLLVYPKAPVLSLYEVLGDGTLSHVGVETLLRPGHSEEFTSLREYHEGDNPRRIHWPSSARHERFFIKEFREEITTKVSLILDMHRLALSGLGDVTSIEYIIKAAAAVAQIAIDKSHLVQLFALSDKMQHVPPGGGTQHLITILDRLTLLRPRGDGHFEDGLEEVMPYLKSGSTAILIAAASNIHTEKITPIIRQLMNRRIKIMIILVDDRSFIKFWKDQEEHMKRATPIAELKEVLSREGCSLFLVAKGDDVALKLQMPV
jgi:uncharacterized protein (DUF58 family)